MQNLVQMDLSNFRYNKINFGFSAACMQKEIYIIRHGETDFNQLGIVQGKGVNSSINQLGRAQAMLFFERYKTIGFEKIYTSSLKRTHQTVAPFIEMGIPVEHHTGLDEISWGIHEGKQDPESFKEFYRVLHEWKQGNVSLSIENGESPLVVQNRQLAFLAELRRSTEQKVLICSHGRAIRILLCTMLDEPLHKMDTFPHQNVSLYKLLFDGKGFTIELFNDITHLNAD